MGYIVRCGEPDGGDVIEGRRAPVESQHSDLRSAVQRLAVWYRRGANGTVRSAELLDAETRQTLSVWEEMERLGMDCVIA